MMIDALASQSHWADHIRPVFDALPNAGTFYTRGRLGLGDPAIVASFVDARQAHQRAVIYMEHGVGQTYVPGHPSYAGGKHKDRVGLFLSPSERVAELNRARYPNAEHAVIGCPLLDRWLGHRPANPEPVVALAWHFNSATVAPEARSAFLHYAEAIPSLPFRLLGHGHPRAIKGLASFYEEHGIEWTDSFAEVMERADVLVFDNTSAGFIFAATGRPVVVVDAPWYQKTWGGRFWNWADVGVRIGDPRDLEHAIDAALLDPPIVREQREAIVADIFAHLDGSGTQRAVGAIADWAGELEAAA